MTNLQNSPTIAKFEGQLTTESTAIISSLKRRLNDNDAPIAQGVMNCINDGTPVDKIIREIKEMAADSYTSMANLVGDMLLLSIINFK